MNILFITHFFEGFMVSEIPKVSVFDYFPLYIICIYLTTHIIIADINEPSRSQNVYVINNCEGPKTIQKYSNICVLVF